MVISDNSINLIKMSEGCRLKAYPDPATKSDPYTIGYGHTGKDVTKDLIITKERAVDLLKEDLLVFCKQVDRLKLTLNQIKNIVQYV